MSAQTRSIGDLYSYGTAAEKALIDTNNIPPGFRYFETDTGAQYQWNGAAWVSAAFMPTGSHVGNSVAADTVSLGDSFRPSAYGADKSVTNTASGEALASGARNVLVVNFSATNTIRVAFGIDTTDAIANVTAGGVPVRAGSERIIVVPSNAAAVAWVNDAAGPDSVYIGHGG